MSLRSSHSSEVAVIILRGAGKAFSAGVDVAAHTPDKIEEMLTKFHGLIRALVATKKITIAAVRGRCLGGGAELAMVCDIVYSSDDAEWGFPEIKLGCYPAGRVYGAGCFGGAQASGRDDSDRAHRSMAGKRPRLDLATRAASEQQLDSALHVCVGQLFRLSPAALAVAKKANYAWDSMHFDKGLARAEKIYFEELMKTADAQEGIRAFHGEASAEVDGEIGLLDGLRNHSRRSEEQG